MNMTSINEKIVNVVGDVLRIAPSRVTDDLSMQTMDTWDSLKHMELVASLEESFGVQLTFDDIVAMRSVAEIKRLLNARGGPGA